VTGQGLINLCIPVSLGGLGVKADIKEFTVRQAIIARKNSKSFRPLRLDYDWLPFTRSKKKVVIPKRKPKGVGRVTQYGVEHIMPAYQSTEESRILSGDNWLASMSRMRYSGRRGRIVVRGSFYKKFASISNTLVRLATGRRLRLLRTTNFKELERNMRIPEVLVKGRFRQLWEGRVSFGIDNPPVVQNTQSSRDYAFIKIFGNKRVDDNRAALLALRGIL